MWACSSSYVVSAGAVSPTNLRSSSSCWPRTGRVGQRHAGLGCRLQRKASCLLPSRKVDIAAQGPRRHRGQRDLGWGSRYRPACASPVRAHSGGAREHPVAEGKLLQFHPAPSWSSKVKPSSNATAWFTIVGMGGCSWTRVPCTDARRCLRFRSGPSPFSPALRGRCSDRHTACRRPCRGLRDPETAFARAGSGMLPQLENPLENPPGTITTSLFGRSPRRLRVSVMGAMCWSSVFERLAGRSVRTFSRKHYGRAQPTGPWRPRGSSWRNVDPRVGPSSAYPGGLVGRHRVFRRPNGGDGRD